MSGNALFKPGEHVEWRDPSGMCPNGRRQLNAYKEKHGEGNLTVVRTTGAGVMVDTGSAKIEVHDHFLSHS